MKNLYRILGVKKTASQEEITKAFREKARSTHPDCQGDIEEFKLINFAYKVLSNPIRRKLYDETGECEQGVADVEEHKILIILSKALGNAVDAIMGTNSHPSNENVPDLISRVLDKGIQTGIDQITEKSIRIAYYKEVAQRICSIKGDNYLKRMAEFDVVYMKKEIEELEAEISRMKKAKEMLKDFAYESFARGYEEYRGSGAVGPNLSIGYRRLDP